MVQSLLLEPQMRWLNSVGKRSFPHELFTQAQPSPEPSYHTQTSVLANLRLGTNGSALNGSTIFLIVYLCHVRGMVSCSTFCPPPLAAQSAHCTRVTAMGCGQSPRSRKLHSMCISKSSERFRHLRPSTSLSKVRLERMLRVDGRWHGWTMMKTKSRGMPFVVRMVAEVEVQRICGE